MSCWGICMVKDEADVIEGTLRHMAGEGVEGIIVADNGSTDGTREILAGLDIATLGCDLIVRDDADPAYYQSRKMTALANMAHNGYDAEWIIPFDADELWLAEDRVAVILEKQPDRVKLVKAALFNHYPTGLDAPWPEHVAYAEPDPFRRLEWHDPHPLPLPKVAVRWRKGSTIHAGNHGADVPGRGAAADVGVHIRHFPYRDRNQFIRKARNGAAAYAATDLPAHTGAHWREYGVILDRDGPEALAELFLKHFYKQFPVEEGLIFDPAAYRRWE